MSNKTPKIFIIGFNKTATRTIHYFFKNNGINSVHWDNNRLVEHLESNIKNNLPLLGPQKVFNKKVNSDCTYQDAIVLSDMTHAELNKNPKDYYKILDKQYVGSKFILNCRNVESWIESRLKHGDGSFAENQMIFHKCSLAELKNIWRNMYNEHIYDVNLYFKNRESDLLIFNIDIDGKSPKKIIDFLENEYPLLNKEFWEKKGKTGKKKS